MDIELSIIIPVYNSDKYLEECLNSVLGLIEDDMEVLLINDGSTDNSKIICEKYKKKSKNIKYFENINMGCSATRNFGLEKSKGKYITFLDSDDYYLKNLKFSKLLKIMKEEELDIIVYGYEKKQNEKLIDYIPNKMKNKEELYNSTLFFNIPWNKIYKKTILKNVKFPLETHMGEDLAFNFIALHYAKKIKILSKKYYCYRDNITSVSYNSNKFLDIFEAFEYILNYFSNDNLKNDEQKKLKKLYVNNAIIEPYRGLIKMKEHNVKIDYNKILEQKKLKQEKLKYYFKSNFYIYEKYGEIRFKYNKIFNFLKNK